MKIFTVVYATFAAAKRKPEKIQACMGFESCVYNCDDICDDLL